jgi:arylsulfatase A-like enzyme
MKSSSRREFLKKSMAGTMGAVVAGGAMGRVFGTGRERSAPAVIKKRGNGNRPNILYVFADQLRYSAVGASGNQVIRTPHLNRMAEEGAFFEQAFSSCPICSPYRCQLITGRYSHKNGVVDNEYKPRTDQVTMHQALKEVGYRTAHIGKWHLGYGPFTEEKRYGLDYMFANTCDHHHYSATYYENERGPIKTHGWSPEIETNRAMELMESYSLDGENRPFSIHIGFGPPHNHYGGSPHLPYDMYPGEFNIYDPARIDLPKNVPVPLADFARNEIADYYANVTALDFQMGRLFRKLEELGIIENTIVCFSSDHGDHLRSYGYGGPGDRWLHYSKRANKATPHEEAVHIPFIIRYPDKIKGGLRTQTMFNSVDVMPTLLSLCGVDIPEKVQGHNLSHAALGEKGYEPDSVYLQILGHGWPHRGKWVGLWRGLRTHRYTYARWKDDEYRNMLFDREKDTFEMKNLSGEKAYAKVEEEMEARLQRWIEETEDPFDTGERDPETGMLALGQEFTHDKYYSDHSKRFSFLKTAIR